VRNSARAARVIDCPPDVEAQTFADWLEVRKAKRAGPVTQTVLDGIRREAGKAGISLQDAIAHCCLAGWQGFRADWYTAARQTASGQPRVMVESFAERERRLKREQWEQMTGQRWPGDERVIDADVAEVWHEKIGY
jgi:hypothetical protein